MTKEEFNKLSNAYQYIADAEGGCYNLGYYKGILEKLSNHKTNGTQSISCYVEFIHEHVMIDADILIKIYEDKIASIEAKVAECKNFIGNSKLIIMATVNDFLYGMPKKIKYDGNIYSASLEINEEQEFYLSYTHGTSWLNIDNSDKDLNRMPLKVRDWIDKHIDEIEVIEYYE